MDNAHHEALHLDAMLEDLAHQSTDFLTDIRQEIHTYSGPDTSGLNKVIAERIDEIMADRP